jgi:hypothetical protein
MHILVEIFAFSAYFGFFKAYLAHIFAFSAYFGVFKAYFACLFRDF